MVTAAYFFLLALVLGLGTFGCWFPALLAAVAALGLVYRFEIRWLWDHTPFSPHDPRPVPPPRRG